MNHENVIAFPGAAERQEPWHHIEAREMFTSFMRHPANVKGVTLTRYTRLLERIASELEVEVSELPELVPPVLLDGPSREQTTG